MLATEGEQVRSRTEHEEPTGRFGVAALYYVQHGWPVIPLHTVRDGQCTCGRPGCNAPGKHPLLNNWPEKATTDATVIDQWGTRWPEANVGVITGPTSGLLVLDVDPRNEGQGTLEALEREYGALPSTPQVLTGGGGQHYWFLYPNGELHIKGRSHALGPGLDVKAAGGFVVAPPSVTKGHYLWEVEHRPDDVPLAELPSWLLERLMEKNKVDRQGNEPAPKKIPEGKRNDTLTSLAGTMRRQGMTEEEITVALLAVNKRCKPPLEEDEVRRIAKSITRYPPADEKLVEKTTALQGSTPSFDLTTAMIEFKDLVTLEIPERKRHLAWLSEGSNVMVFGPRGVGKTMMQLALAAALTTRSPLLKWPVTAPVGVLYVDGEMPLDELRNRATALLPKPPEAPLCFLTSEWVYHKLHRDLVLTSEAMRDQIMRILDAHPDIRVVILDNISCLFTGISEDKKQDWEPIAAWLIRLRHRGIATVLVHHAGKGGQQRGTSGREDALDTVVELDTPTDYDLREGCHFELRFTKSRSVKGEDVAPLDVRLEEHNGQLLWTYRALEESKLNQVRRLIEEGVTLLTDIAEELDITKGYASKLARKAKAQHDST